MRWLAARARRLKSPQTPGFPSQACKAAVVKSACRICHSFEEHEGDPLVAPCRCDGSLRYVHNSCQQAWLSVRKAGPDGLFGYNCELCRSSLACRLTLATHVELGTVAAASLAVWAAQAMTVVRAACVVAVLFVAEGGAQGNVLVKRIAMLFPPLVKLVGTCEALAHVADQHLLVAGITVVVAHCALASIGRPLAFLSEATLARLCVVKIGGCVLVCLHEVLRRLPSQRFAPAVAWHSLGMILLMDHLLLALLRIPREERCGRSFGARYVQAVYRCTGDFLPFAALFFFWLSTVVVIFTVSLVPSTVLIFHEAVRNIRWRRYRHGSIQMVLMLARTFTWLLSVALRRSAAGPWASRCDRGVAGVWLVVEALVLLDLYARRRGNCRETLSQVLWGVAVVGQATLTLGGRLSGSVRSPGLGSNLGGAGGVLLAPGLGGGDAMAGPGLAAHRLHRVLRARGGWAHGGSPASALEDVALAFTIACFLSIHMPAFAVWLGRTKRLILHAFMQAMHRPDQVVFYDSPHHRQPV